MRHSIGGPAISPAISVIIPTFNRGHVLGVALESVLAQGYRDLEAIVVDDGSSDGTRTLVAGIVAADPRVSYAYQPNSGVSSARNAGLEVASGEFIAFLDSDDSWKPWHLALLMAGLDRLAPAGLIWTDMDSVDAVGTVISAGYLPRLLSAYRYFSKDELFSTSLPLSELGIELPPEYDNRRLYMGDVFSAMLMGNLLAPSSVLMRRERLERVGGFDESLSTGEDYEFFLRVCRAGPVAFADIADVRYRIGTVDRLSGPEMALPIARAYLQVLERTLAEDGDRITLSPTLITEARGHAYRWVGEAELATGSRRAARRHLVMAFRIGARRPWIAALLLASMIPRAALTRLIRWRRRIRGWLGQRSNPTVKG